MATRMALEVETTEQPAVLDASAIPVQSPSPRAIQITVKAYRGGIDVIRHIEPEWLLLSQEAHDPQPFYRPEWFAAYLSTFASGQHVLLLAARVNGRLKAVLPLLEERAWRGPFSMKKLRAASCVHCLRFDLIRSADSDGTLAGQAIWNHLTTSVEWDTLEMEQVPAGGALDELATAAPCTGATVERKHGWHSPYISLPASVSGESPQLRLGSSKFRKHLNRAWQKLAEQAPLTLQRFDVATPELLERFYRLEAAGWKGRTGSAIAMDAPTRRFYDQICRAASSFGYFRLFFLVSNSRDVSAQIGFAYEGRYYLAKPAYDEAFRQSSPGHLLVKAVLDDCLTAGHREFHFLGAADDWKKEWTGEFRKQYRMLFFNRTWKGRVRHALMFTRLKRAIKKIRLRRPNETGGARLAQSSAQNKAQKPAPLRGRLFATSLPLLRPAMLHPRKPPAAAPFPLGSSQTRYFYFARNGIYALAQYWNLAGREVLFPSYCEGVELETLRSAGARLRFYPVGKGMRVNLEEVISRIGPETRAIYLIHYLGFPGPVGELAEECRKRKLLLIEDCALAMLSRLGDLPLGSWGDAAIFSIHKTLPVPNGGAAVLRHGNPAALKDGVAPPWATTLALTARSLDCYFRIRGRVWPRRLLRAAGGVGRFVSQFAGRQPIEVGTSQFNPGHVGLAISPLSHWVMAAQDYKEVVANRRRNYLHLLSRLQNVAEPVFPVLARGVCPLSYPLLTEDKAAKVDKFRAAGVEAINMWSCSHPTQETFPETDDLRRRVLELPCHQDLTPEDVERIVAVAREIL